MALEAAAGSLVPGPLLGTAVASVALGDLAGPVAAGEMRVALALGNQGVVHDAPGATHALLVRGDEVVLVPLDATELKRIIDENSPSPMIVPGTDNESKKRSFPSRPARDIDPSEMEKAEGE